MQATKNSLGSMVFTTTVTIEIDREHLVQAFIWKCFHDGENSYPETREEAVKVAAETIVDAGKYWAREGLAASDVRSLPDITESDIENAENAVNSLFPEL